MVKKVPFRVSRDDTRSLLRQVEDGLREAIVGGFYKPGESVPSSRELVSMLGVSRIVTQAALRRIADEGLVVSRPRVGSVVRDRGERQWRGHVVFAYAEMNVGYFQTGFAEELRKLLNRDGYLFTRATGDSGDETGTADFSLLDVALSRSVDLVVVLTNSRGILQYLARRRIPFAAVTHRETKPAGAVGVTHFDLYGALDGFAAACRGAGIRKAAVMHWTSGIHEATQRLRAAGMSVSSVVVAPNFSLGKLTAIERAGYEEFRRRIEAGRLGRDTAWFFADDYLARGALMAMAAAGVRAPEDIRVATLSNAGNGPLYVRDLARLEMDPVRAGATVASAALEYLKTGRYPEDSVIGPIWIPGETMGDGIQPPLSTSTDSRRPSTDRRGSHRSSHPNPTSP